MPWYAILALVISTTTAVGLCLGVFWANIKNKYTDTNTGNYEATIKSYEDVVKSQNVKISIQAEEIKQLRIDHSTSMKEIGKLQGELKSYKELPLQQLSDNMMIVTQLTTLIAAHLKIDGLDQIDVTKPIK
jgi:predicted transcriptional regulator